MIARIALMWMISQMQDQMEATLAQLMRYLSGARED